jgi:hypothetical protein
VKALLFKRPWWGGLVGLAGLFVLCSAAVHPFGSVKRPHGQNAAENDLQLPAEIAPLLKRSCMDCHSNRTVWPWYSYVAPMSWMVERDVHRAREHMNLSEWDQYSSGQREKLLTYIASEVRSHEMPPPQYTLIHRDAKLSAADTDHLYRWARAERRKLRAKVPVLPTSGGRSERKR